MVPLASLVDIAFLGHLVEIDYLAGVALAAVLFKYLYWTFGFLRMATTGLTAQAQGQGDSETVWLILLRNLLVACGIGLLILTLQDPLRKLGFWLLSATPEVKAAGVAYYNALIWGAPATLMNFVFLGWFLGREQGGRVFLLSLIVNISNVVFNYWFIVRWDLASAGAGWGTALSQYLMLFTGLFFLAQEQAFGQFQQAIPRLWDQTALRVSFALNLNILIRTFALTTVFALFTNFSSALGTEVLATNALLLEAVTLSAYFLDGLAFATESLAGSFQGKASPGELAWLARWSGGWSLGLGLGLALLFISAPESLFRLLTDHEDVIAGVQQYVLWLLPILGFGSLAFMLDGYFLGLTAGKILRQGTVIAAVISSIPMVLGAKVIPNPHLLWFALAVFMFFRMVTLGIRLPATWR
ncbi:MAG: MATE family efflux transporter [Oscillatoriales cyanobacterium RM1_1_9]|nr:MATE family efflux transporter [Oscillatoriales cyanobacterium SM2_3_0]NJO45091.1 MATE family efflux transporter [Oscillatoriales cyanobacterium RM2_1_1]NJO70588.1 MATE family efflux transporter [Oscillatoriales cyanobacterium RM1_1_9]